MWVGKHGYLLCAKSGGISVEPNLDHQGIVEFIRQADERFSLLARLVSAVNGTKASVSVFQNSSVTILADNKIHSSVIISASKLQSESQIVQKLLPRAAGVLVRRPIGLRMYVDAMRSETNTAKVIELFRLIEAAFERKGSRLAGVVVPFLSSGVYKIDLKHWERIKSTRDRLAHAYNVGSIIYENEAIEITNDLSVISADVLLHKRTWGSPDLARGHDNLFASYRGSDGILTLVQGTEFRLNVQVLDPVSGLPVNLDPSPINRFRNRLRSKLLPSTGDNSLSNEASANIS
jgi:hypothetical protein